MPGQSACRRHHAAAAEAFECAVAFALGEVEADAATAPASRASFMIATWQAPSALQDQRLKLAISGATFGPADVVSCCSSLCGREAHLEGETERGGQAF
jgi:hypothetical protein